MGREPSPPLPPEIQSLDDSLVRRWTISDDVLRDQAISAAAVEELLELVDKVNAPVFAAINRYLDGFGGHEQEGVVWLHDIPQASMEASIELQRRAGRLE